MALDVETPDPPDLSNRGVPSAYQSVEEVGGAADLRRQELEEILREGSWTEAFEEWAAHTDLSMTEYRLVTDLQLLREFDFYWDPSEERTRFEAPSVPENWREASDVTVTPDEIDATLIESELANLGDTVVKMLEDAYVDWEESGSSDYVWSEETFGQGPQE